MKLEDLRALTTYALGIAAGWWLAGRWGAGLAAGFFCAARVYATMRREAAK
jgi:hypothetical protein